MLAFGTDGVRGKAFVDITLDDAYQLGVAIARSVKSRRAAVGRDPRISGPALELALVEGLTSEGVEVLALGMVPTPCVAFASEVENITGIAITASHNQYEDNGVKVFAPGGVKLTDEAEAAIVRELATVAKERAPRTAAVIERGRMVDRYVESRIRMVRQEIGAGLRVVLDCANGAMSEVAPEVFRRLGAQVDLIHALPDGTNINAECGATAPESLGTEVVAVRASIGFAFDGDGDRLVVVDERGNVVEGDRLLGLLAHYMRANERLHSNTLVTTVMSNIGLLRAMEQAGINVAVTTVGDRYVLDHMNQHGFTLGGEQSGHVIIRDRATTGDGLMAAIAVLELMVDSGRPISQLADEVMITVPQVLINVKTNVPAGETVSRMQDEIDAAVRELGTRGRVLVRASGTEPLVRVMVECDSAQEAQRVAEGLAARATSL